MKQNQQQLENQPKNKYDLYFIYFIDTTIRSLIAFSISVLITIFIIGFTKIPTWWLLPIAFFMMLAINPLLSKVKLGEIVRQKYISYLNEMFGKK